MKKILLFLSLFLFSISCTPFSNPYTSASPEKRENFKKVRVPLKSNTRFTLVQGPFDGPSHNRRGDEYSWDFGVPFGTPVVAAESGKVIGIWEPGEGSRCSSGEDFFHLGHYVRIKHGDGTIAQYVHVNSKVHVGEVVEKGQLIAVTAKNGWLCVPHLHFGIYQSARKINAPDNRNIPLYFEGIEGGLLKARERYKTPAYPLTLLPAPTRNAH